MKEIINFGKTIILLYAVNFYGCASLQIQFCSDKSQVKHQNSPVLNVQIQSEDEALAKKDSIKLKGFRVLE